MRGLLGRGRRHVVLVVVAAACATAAALLAAAGRGGAERGVGVVALEVRDLVLEVLDLRHEAGAKLGLVGLGLLEAVLVRLLQVLGRDLLLAHGRSLHAAHDLHHRVHHVLHLEDLLGRLAGLLGRGLDLVAQRRDLLIERRVVALGLSSELRDARRDARESGFDLLLLHHERHALLGLALRHSLPNLVRRGRT